MNFEQFVAKECKKFGWELLGFEGGYVFYNDDGIVSIASEEAFVTDEWLKMNTIK